MLTNNEPTDRYCDIVMKGGITSGIVYPPAICKLAEQYRFKNIGGTSAGAIAAAITAAAEYRRRTTGSMAGFALVDQLPNLLKQVDAKGRTQLFRLFQPDPPCRRLFGILATALNASGTINRIVRIVRGCVISYWPAILLSIVVSLLVVWPLHSVRSFMLLWLVLLWLVLLWLVLLLLVLLPAFLGAWIYFDFTRHVVGNNYGLCKGMTTDPTAGPALTPWLHGLIQSAAGLPLERPLTFGDLWDAPGGPNPPPNCVTGGRSIDLRMFTTNLAHGRPYIFPHEEPMARLFFKTEELAPYLPAEVMKWVRGTAVPYAQSAISPKSDPPVEAANKLELLEIPPPRRFPILLAARMSLSFPLLFAAVPFWAIDYETYGERTFKRCMFSDGGISSNFPVHLFDGLIPSWPTFGIDLEAKLDHPSWTFLPEHYLQGIADRWARFDQKGKPASRLGGFLMSIGGTMQNWNDNVQSRLAGVRDRVVRVRLADNEGGMNLNMLGPVIDRVAARGALAAADLTARYPPQPPTQGWDGWSSQRWVRLDVILYALGQKISGMGGALAAQVPYSTSYADLVARAQNQAPPGHNSPLSLQEAAALTALIIALDAANQAFGGAAPSYPITPLPESELRARSPL